MTLRWITVILFFIPMYVEDKNMAFVKTQSLKGLAFSIAYKL